MAKEVVTIEGLRECKKALRKLPDTTAKNVLRRIMRNRAEPIVATAKRLVPVDEGELRDSIVASTKLSKRQRRRYKKQYPDDVELFIGPGSHPQAHLQEFGSSIHPPQPFMRPAWDMERHKILDNLAQDLWIEIEKATLRAARKAAKASK